MSIRSGKFAVLAAAVSVSAALIGTSAASATAAPTAEIGTHQFGNETAANTALVVYLYNQLLYQNNSAVIDKYVSPTYKQHNPTLADGPQGLRAYIDWRRAQNPQPRNIIKRVIAQGDLVTIMNDYQQTPGVSYMNIADTFRVEHGKLTEHWDVIDPVPTTTTSGNDLYSTLSRPQVNTPDPTAPTRRNQHLVERYFDGLTKRHDPSVIDRYVATNLYQHDPALPNGASAVKAAYLADRAANPNSIVSSEMIIAEGDLVTIHYHYQANATDLGKAVQEVFRVRGGKIVEHWDAQQDVPATAANPNTMF
jgi:predicted SnoaL-like aldol condensation-catalyzing enzyme